MAAMDERGLVWCQLGRFQGRPFGERRTRDGLEPVGDLVGSPEARESGEDIDPKDLVAHGIPYLMCSPVLMACSITFFVESLNPTQDWKLPSGLTRNSTGTDPVPKAWPNWRDPSMKAGMSSL